MPAMKGAKVRRVTFYQTVNPSYPECHCTRYDSKMVCDCMFGRNHTRKRVEYIVPATPEAMEALVEKAANALCCEHMGALPGAHSLTPEKDCAKGSESAYMWRSARAALRALLGRGKG